MNRLLTLTAVLSVLLLHTVTVSGQDTAAMEFTSSATVLELVGEKTSAYFANVIDVNTSVEWSVFVPENYDPEIPAGLIVYVSPSDSGKIPSAWKSVMAEQNLIWVSANDSGNSVDGGLRITYAILAPTLARKDYNIDRDRVYLSGLSGGGRVASIAAPEYPHIFSGAIYNCGVNFWGKETPTRLEQVQNNRYVFVTGSKDFNRRETRKAFNSYKKAGAENVKLMDIAHMGHENPSSTKMTEAITFLDAGS